MSTGDHRPRGVLGAEEDRTHVDGEGRIPLVDVLLGDRPEGTADPCVVEHHVEAAERLDREGDQGGHVIFR